MLVLSRKVSEKIVIDGKITITIVEVRGNKVRLGIVAPKEVTVHREEIQQQVDAGVPAHSRPTALKIPDGK